MPTKLTIACLLIAVAAGGCCSSGEGFVRPGFDFSGVRRVAVAEITGVGNEAAKTDIGDLFARELLKRGYEPVERRQIKAVLTEQEFQQTDFTSPVATARLGRVANVDAIIVGNLAVLDEERVSMTAKLLDVEDASILWMGSGSGRTGRTLFTVIGGAFGAAAGWAFGGDPDGKQAGAIGGAVAGGMIGRSLSPERREQARKAIRVIFDSFPPRALR